MTFPPTRPAKPFLTFLETFFCEVLVAHGAFNRPSHTPAFHFGSSFNGIVTLMFLQSAQVITLFLFILIP